MDDFDFDYWRHLAERDPVAYFRVRAAVIRRFIAAHPEHGASLLELQGKIDTIRAVSGGPVEACRAMCVMMGYKLAELSGQLSALQAAAAQLQELAERVPRDG
ncbi:MAG: DUF3135 domain-containing protein [Zoogloea sp.]|nr:DUF3135 domain-containing protein [Zoogloea sp.]